MLMQVLSYLFMLIQVLENMSLVCVFKFKNLLYEWIVLCLFPYKYSSELIFEFLIYLGSHPQLHGDIPIQPALSNQPGNANILLIMLECNYV